MKPRYTGVISSRKDGSSTGGTKHTSIATPSAGIPMPMGIEAETRRLINTTKGSIRIVRHIVIDRASAFAVSATI